MSYSLNSIVINPNSKSSPKNAIIICHGYGGDAKDISIVANYWKTFLTDTLFVCPNAPEICKVNPDGFQWFDLMDQTDDEILSQSLIAENKLNKLIDEVKETNKFKIDDIALVGFSQGCMLSLQTALKRKDEIGCLIGYSGKILNPLNFLLEAKDFFNKHKYKINIKIFKNCEHKIPIEGLSAGLQFLKKYLYK